MSISELRRHFGAIVTLHPWSGGSAITFTTFGSCLADNVEVPCSIAVGRLFEGGWKEWSESRDVEMRGILEMLRSLNVLFWIFSISSVLACFAIIEWRKKRQDKSVRGSVSRGERYRRIAIMMMALSTLTLAITSYIGLQLSRRLSVTILGSMEYPSLNTSILGTIGLIYVTVWFKFQQGGSSPAVGDADGPTNMEKLDG